MRKIFLFIFTILSISIFAIDWNSKEWLADGAGEGKYANKYKVAAAYGQTVVNIQKPEWAAEPGIYTNFPAGDLKLTGLDASKYKVEGAGVLLYLSAFTQKETSLSVAAGGVDYDFTVFYADGTGEVSTDPDPGKPDPENPGEQTTAATFKSQTEAEVAGAKVMFDWSITYNADKTLTFEISWNQDIAGVVPQICLKGAYSTMPNENKKAIFTTKDTYNAGDALGEAFFWIAYTGNAARIDIKGYKVGDSNVKPEDPGSTDPETPGSTDPETPGSTDPETPGNEGIDTVTNDQLPMTNKVIVNGVLYIERNGIRYTATGAAL